MPILDWFYSLTPHQLDALRTLASIAVAVGTMLSAVSVVYARLAAKRSQMAVDQTRTTQWIDGKQYPTSVAKLAEHNVNTTEELRGEITHAFNIGPKVHGRRRNTPTNQVQQIEANHHEQQ